MTFTLRKLILFLATLECLVLIASASSIWNSFRQSEIAVSANSTIAENSTSSESDSEEDDDEFNGVYDNPDLIGFYLYYDPANPDAHDHLDYRNFTSVMDSHFDPKKATKFLIHGFTQNGTSSFPMNVKNAYLEHTGTEFNVIAVDWGKLSTPKVLYPLFYGLAQANVPVVGKRVGEFIVLMKENNYTTEAQIHIVGFSLGAHVASNAGYYVQKTTGTKIARISGLDPAGPGFFLTQPLVKRLDDSDADFVDVIHGNAGGLGYPLPLGHVNFFPNGGTLQPTCGLSMSTFADSLTGLLSGSCSHGKAPVFFAMSLNPENLPKIVSCKCLTYAGYELYCGRTCKTKSVFGEYISPTTRGNYFLDVIPELDKELPEVDAQQAANLANNTTVTATATLEIS